MASDLCKLVSSPDLAPVVRFCDVAFASLSKRDAIALINSPTSEPPFKETALHYAAYAGHIATVRYLLEKNADPFSTISYVDATPLHSAAAGNNAEILRLLIHQQTDEKKAPINHQTTTKWTPMHCCVSRGFVEIAKILRNHGGSIDIPNNSNVTCRAKYEELLATEFATLPKQGQASAKNNVIQLSGLSIQIASDLHLEFYGDSPIHYSEIIIPSAPILALLGDIGIPYIEGNTNYRDFLLHMAQHFELVLVITGNHEYYHCEKENISVEQVNEEIERICSLHPNLCFMNKKSLLVNDVRILGCTLWSFIPEHAYSVCGSSLNDYKCIMMLEDGELQRLTPKVSSRWFEEDLSWLRAEVEEANKKGESIVVLSHHTPSFFQTSAPEYTTHPWKSSEEVKEGDRRWVNCCFSSDLESFFASSNIKVWAYGHTHYCNDQIIHGTRLIANQRGYLHNQDKNYSPRCVFHTK